MQNLKDKPLKITEIQLYSVSNKKQYLEILAEYNFELYSFKNYKCTYIVRGRVEDIFFEVDYNHLIISMVSKLQKVNKVVYDGNLPIKEEHLEILLHDFLNISKKKNSIPINK